MKRTHEDTLDPTTTTNKKKSRMHIELEFKFDVTLTSEEKKVKDILEKCTWIDVIRAYTTSDKDIMEYVKFIWMKVTQNDVGENPKLSSSYFVDRLWHRHLLNPVSYYEMCCTDLGLDKPIYHNECTIYHNKKERYTNTVILYERFFIRKPIHDHVPWPDKEWESSSSGDDVNREWELSTSGDETSSSLSLVSNGNITEVTQIIFVIDFNGKSHAFDYDKTRTIKSIKDQMVTTKLKIENIRFIYAGKNLENNRTLEYYNIIPNETLHATPKIMGC